MTEVCLTQVFSARCPSAFQCSRIYTELRHCAWAIYNQIINKKHNTVKSVAPSPPQEGPLFTVGSEARRQMSQRPRPRSPPAPLGMGLSSDSNLEFIVYR